MFARNLRYSRSACRLMFPITDNMKQEPIPLTNITQNGVVREAAVGQFLQPSNTVELMLNLHCDKIGEATLRKGLTIVGSQVESGAPVLGMVNYRNNARDTFRLLAKIDTDVYAWNGSNWTSVRSGLTASGKARFTNFVDYTFMVNGAYNQALQTYNGTFGTTNVASLPAGDVIENYRSRIWIGDGSTDKLYYSDVVTTSNTITGGTSFLQISPQDGEKITALKRTSRALIVFKNDHIYRVFSINSTDPDPSIRRGTYSQESVIEGKNGISYHHPTGFYDFVFDGEQREISRPIIDIVEAIPRSYYENVSGWVDADHKYWSIGDITLGGISFNNIVVRYTISTQVWTVYSYGSEPRCAVEYDDGTTLTTVIGDHDGSVLTFDSGTSDNGAAVHYDLQTHWIYFTTIRSTSKDLTEITSLHENAHGGNLSYQLDSDLANEWRPIGSLIRDIYQIDSLNAIGFNRIRFRFHVNTVGSPFSFRGWELLSLITEGSIKSK